MGGGNYGRGGFGGQGRITDWSTSLRAYPSTFLSRMDINPTNKIILPSSVLSDISNYNLPQPMIFKLTTFDRRRSVHCGVIEFVAPDETMVLPQWLFNSLMIPEGAM